MFSQRFKKLEVEHFSNFGPVLFNCLPRDIRNITRGGTNAFKMKFDKFLTTIPDEPPVTNTPNPPSVGSNCTIDQMQLFNDGKCSRAVDYLVGRGNLSRTSMKSDPVNK